MTTLAISQGMLVLFLIRTRGHMLAQATELLKLQRDSSEILTINEKLQKLTEQIKTLEEITLSNSKENPPENATSITSLHLSNIKKFDSNKDKVVPLAAVGS